MSLHARIGAGVLVVLLTHTASGAVLGGPVVNPANGHGYFLLDSTNWTDAEAAGEAMGGHLATIRSAAENNWMLATFAHFRGVDHILWIGLYDPSQDQNGGTHASNFVWVDGEPVTFTNWAAGEPNNLGHAEYWAQMGASFAPLPPGVGTWNDVPNDKYPYQGNTSGLNFGPVYGVVEVVPEPVYLLSIAGALLLRRRGKHPFSHTL